MAADEGSRLTMNLDPHMRQLFDVLVDVAARREIEKARGARTPQAENSPRIKEDGDGRKSSQTARESRAT